MPRGDYNRKLSQILLFLALTPAAKSTIYAPTSTLRLSQRGILQPALDFGQGGAWTHGYIGNQRSGGNGAAVGGAFPFSGKSEGRRVSGWSAGFFAGISQTAHREGVLFSPGLYSFEVMLGRGTTVPFLEKDSGLRGFLEFALRDDRSLGQEENRIVFRNLKRVFPKHRYSLAIRMGATQELDGQGIVEQGPAKISYRLIYSFYVPLSKQLPMTSLHASGLFRCGLQKLGCGLGIDAIHIWPDKKNHDDTLDLREYLSFGPQLRWALGKKHFIRGHLAWNFHHGASGTGTDKIHRTIFSKSPFGELEFSTAF